jgi:hypothetical protein
MDEIGWAIQDIKEYDHLKLQWIRGKGYRIYDTNQFPEVPLLQFREGRWAAIEAFDRFVLDYLKKKYEE